MKQKHQKWAGRVTAAITLCAVLSAVFAGGAAAADPADAQITVKNATDIDGSGPLPDLHSADSRIIVSNNDPTKSYQKSDVSFASNNTTINKSVSGAGVIGTINKSDVPESGPLSVDVNVNGTSVGSYNISKLTYQTNSVNVRSETLNRTEQITVTVDISQIDRDGYLVDGPQQRNSLTDSERSILIKSETGRLPYPGFVADIGGNATQTVTVNRSDYAQDYERQFFNDTLSDSQGDNTLYFTAAVEKVKIDGKTVYSPAPLGGGGGSGGSGSGAQIALMLVVVAGVLVLIKQ